MDLTAARTESDTFTIKVIDYKVKAHNMDAGTKRNNITVSALVKGVEELELENDTLRTESISITKEK